MQKTMGQIIRELRKERNLTQEELAEQLGVTFQAVSKWENDAGMPDISQVIPLATVFQVSTDVLFGIFGTNHAEEVDAIIREAYAQITYPADRESIRRWYDALHTGLEKYPNNTSLLMQCLEAGISLAYPENDCYDAENGEAIYKTCIREANIVIKYSQNTTDILRAHMIMVLLHAAYGNFQMAREHASAFPWRADMTIHEMNACIAHFEKEYAAENKCCQNDFMYHFEAMLDDLVEMGCCYYHLAAYEKAEYVFQQALAMIALVCKDEDPAPRFHCREYGDLYALLAEVYCKQNRPDDAIYALKKMVHYDVWELAKYTPGKKLNSPLLSEADRNFYWTNGVHRENLLRKLQNPNFAPLREDSRFTDLLQEAENI